MSGKGGSIGNTKTYGTKGNNFTFQNKAWHLLAQIAAGVTVPGGLATEATLTMVLAALQNGKEFEQNLVMDLGGVGCPANCPTYLQVRIWNTTTHTFDPPIYYDGSGAVVVPVGPIQIVNPQFVLEGILAQVTAINADLDVALSTRASEVTLLATNALLGSIVTNTANLDVPLSTRATEATLVAGLAAITAALGPLATEVTLAAFSAKFTAVVRTPVMVRASAAGTVPAGARSASIYNAGGGNATVLGATLLPGERVSFSADGEDDTLAVIAYNGTGTDLLVTYVS